MYGNFSETGKVTGIVGEKAGMTFLIANTGTMIGRDSAVCQIIMRKSAGVSRLHCYITYNNANGTYVISDRNSTYGTFTENGRKIMPGTSVALRRGERFYLGSPQNMFEVG